VTAFEDDLDDLEVVAHEVYDDDVETLIASCACGATWTGPKPEHCMVCHQTFGSTSAGNAHRTGRHDVWEGPNRRRCHDVEWMRGKGWRQDDQGIWRLPSPNQPISYRGAES
jgi:hypothetical protein